tara:strand:+ start:80 stop:607 length:528 start_codon:yes stop_codon:yes gene_type:complete
VKNLIPAWVNGELKPIDKLEVHKRALKHKAISVFIISGNETLVQQRALTKYHTPGLWANACCTHPYWNELPNECAVRRLQEELGIETTDELNYRNQIEYKADVGNGLVEYELVDIFTIEVEVKESIEIRINPDEVMATRWVTFENLKKEIKMSPESFTPWIRIYLNKYARQILPN